MNKCTCCGKTGVVVSYKLEMLGKTTLHQICQNCAKPEKGIVKNSKFQKWTKI